METLHPGRQHLRSTRLRALVVRTPILSVVLVAAAARASFALVSFALNGDSLVPDENQYVALARAVASGAGAESYVRGYGQALYDSTWAFSAPIAFAFQYLEPSRLVPQLYAACFGVATAGLAARLARELVSPGWAVGAGLLVALVPSQVLWSSIVLRESLIWAALAGIAVVLTAGRWRTVRGFLVSTGALIALLLALLHLRTQTAVVAAWALAIAGWFGVGRVGWLRGAAAMGVAALVPVSVGLGLFGFDLVTDAADTMARTRAYLSFDADTAVTTVPKYTGPGSDVVCLDRPRRTGSTTSTAPGANALAGTARRTVEQPDGSTIDLICAPDGNVYAVESGAGRDLAYLPNGLLTTLVRPYPWERSDNLVARLASVENLLWLPLYVAAAVGALIVRRRRDVIAFPLLAAAGLVFTSALSQGNVGTAFRHRAQMLWVLAVLTAVAAEALARRRTAGVA